MFGKKTEGGFFERLKKGLSKTRENLARNLDDMIHGERTIRPELFDELEEALIAADLGPAFTTELIDEMREKVKRNELDRPEVLKTALKHHMHEILQSIEAPSSVPQEGPYTVMIVGVNGTGKTTTIGKLARHFQDSGKSVLLVAADTFRAAAIEQLEVWSERVKAPVIKQKMGSDPSAVVFDAVRAAKSRHSDIVLIDTAGRLHTKVNLMEELKKMKRILGRELPGAPHDIWLVLDATTGQNALNQARMFKDDVGITGIIITKLDGTAKGGILVRIARELQIPIRFIGIGEGLDDLREFDSTQFTDALVD